MNLGNTKHCTLTVTGSSGDLIETERSIRREFRVVKDDNGDVLIGASDGTLLRASFQNGVWRITEVRLGAGTVIDLYQPPEDNVYQNSDVATLHSSRPFEWVLCGTHSATADNN